MYLQSPEVCNFHDHDGFSIMHVSNNVSFFCCRMNKTKILDYLRDIWAIDRKTEWSIWTNYSRVEIPHRYLRSMTDDSSHRQSLLRVSGSRKFHEDVIITHSLIVYICHSFNLYLQA
jgi:hypothetical protein